MEERMSPEPQASPERTTELLLNDKELALLRTGLEMLEDTFGHEEADELEDVQALLARVRALRSGEPGAT